MAIARKKEDNLVDAKITTTPKVADVKKAEKVDAMQPETPKKIKRQGFLRTTIQELRKVRWPSFGYTIRWSGIIILFTLGISLFLGFFDHVFTSGIRFANCTSPQGDGSSIEQCGEDLLSQLTFQDS